MCSIGASILSRTSQCRQALVEESVDDIGAGLAFGGFHHLAGQGVLAFVVAGFDLRHDVGVGGDHFVHFGDDGAVVGHGGEAFGFDDGLGGLAGLEHLGQNTLGSVVGDLAAIAQGQQIAQVGRRDFAFRDIQARGIEQTCEVAGDIVRDGFGVGSSRRGLEVIGERAGGREDGRFILAQAVLRREPFALGIGQFRQGGAGGFHVGVLESAAEPDRVRGSSGTPALLP